MPLSDKAKGKQRQTDDSVSLNFKKETQRELVIRFTEGSYSDLILIVKPRDSVRDVKNLIRTERPGLHSHRLRLIYAGRLLTDGILLYEWLERLDGKITRSSGGGAAVGGADASVEDAGEGERESLLGAAKTSSKGKGKEKERETTWIHCSVGPKIEEGEPEDDEGNSQKDQIKPIRGFDRLASIGFTEEDIASVRAQFHSQAEIDASEGDGIEFGGTDEEYQEHVRALEEQWIDSLDSTAPPTTLSSSPSTSGSSSSSSSSQSSFLQGLIVGFFFPILPFFFMRKVKPAVFWDEEGVEFDGGKNVVFSRRMQMGLVIGLVVNILFGWWRLLLDGS